MKTYRSFPKRTIICRKFSFGFRVERLNGKLWWESFQITHFDQRKIPVYGARRGRKVGRKSLLRSCWCCFRNWRVLPPLRTTTDMCLTCVYEHLTEYPRTQLEFLLILRQVILIIFYFNIQPLVWVKHLLSKLRNLIWVCTSY